jgi:hypothetical protein
MMTPKNLHKSSGLGTFFRMIMHIEAFKFVDRRIGRFIGSGWRGTGYSPFQLIATKE